MKQHNQNRLSYESDGKMGKQKKENGIHKKEQRNFFNTTQSSE